MSDVSHSDHRLRNKSTESVEYILFFVLIFVFAIPFGIVGWISELFRKKSLLINGPLARAWLEAHRITPVIFSV